MLRQRERPQASSRTPFVMLVTANLISTVGGAMSLVALPWFVFAITRDAALTGAAAFCESAAVVAASTCAGWFIRQIGARGVRTASDVVSGIAVLAIPALFELNALRFPILLVLVAVNGFLRTPAVAASYVLLAAVAERAGTTTSAVSGQYVASLQLANAIGAPVAGAAIAGFGAPPVLIGDAISFLVSAALVQLFLPPVSLDEPGEQRASVPAALRLIWRARLLRLIVAISILLSVLGSGWGAVVAPLYGTDVLGNAAALGLVLAAESVGAILGAWSAPRVEPHVPLRWLAPILVAAAVVPLFAAIGSGAPLAGLLPSAFVCGAALGMFGTVRTNIEYRTVPSGQRGHVFGMLTALGQSGAAVGPLLTGILIGASSLTAFAAAAVCAGVVVAAALPFARPLR